MRVKVLIIVRNGERITLKNVRGIILNVKRREMPAGRLITYKGETLRIGQWGKRFDIDPVTIGLRIYKLKWSIHKALTAPPTPQNKVLNYNDGVEMYHFIMARFYTKERRLECYKNLIKDMKELRMKIAA